MGFTRGELEACRGRLVPDLVGAERPRLVIVGINPGLWTAATGTHFAHPSNRFYPALHLAGITDRRLDGSRGLGRQERDHLLGRGLAITNLVPRATARAADLRAEELRTGAAAVARRIADWQAPMAAVAGVGAYRTAFGRPKAVVGRQEDTLGGAQLWVLPNPSGLNAHETVASLASWFRRVAEAAGLLDGPED